jgi:hypothetical protein
MLTTIEIRNLANRPVLVRAKVIGNFAIHRSHPRDGEDQPWTWTLTHVPTGRSFCYMPTLPQTKRALWVWLALYEDWSSANWRDYRHLQKVGRWIRAELDLSAARIARGGES